MIVDEAISGAVISHNCTMTRNNFRLPTVMWSVKRVFRWRRIWAACKHLHFRFGLLLFGYFTVSVNMVLWLNEPDVPVKVRV